MKHSIVGRQRSRAEKHGYRRNGMERLQSKNGAKVALTEVKHMGCCQCCLRNGFV
ncbi:MAG: hypothetical protein WBP08_08290 [Saprospiraceae bacterium]